MKPDFSDPWLEGALSSEASLPALRAAVAAAPDDLAARQLFLGALFKWDPTYAGCSDEHLNEALWWIKRHPGHPGANAVARQFASAGGTSYSAVRAAWQQALEQSNVDPEVRIHAACFSGIQEPEWSCTLLEQAHVLDSKSDKAASLLGNTYLRMSRPSRRSGRTQVDHNLALKALEWFEIALKITRNPNSVTWAGAAAFGAGLDDKALAYAEELLNNFAVGRFGSIDGDAVFHGHNLLGRVALRRGDEAEACRELLESARTHGSPVLGSFGPELALAKELLAKGHREPVLQFLIECQRFWKHHRATVERWCNELRAGCTPTFERGPPE